MYLVQALLALGGRWGEQLQRFLDLLISGHLYRTLGYFGRLQSRITRAVQICRLHATAFVAALASSLLSRANSRSCRAVLTTIIAFGPPAHDAHTEALTFNYTCAP